METGTNVWLTHVIDSCCEPQLMVKKQQKQQLRRDPIFSIEDWFSLLQKLLEEVLGQSIRQQEVKDSRRGLVAISKGTPIFCTEYLL